jgi:ribonuclease T1
MRRIILRLGLAALLLCQPLFGQALGHHLQASATVPVSLAELPREVHDTLRLIQQSGPFPYARDGLVFSNFERHLPPQPRGYYHEYTVKTPGVRNRGARRLVCGTPSECYYTHDHYQTFRRIKE